MTNKTPMASSSWLGISCHIMPYPIHMYDCIWLYMHIYIIYIYIIYIYNLYVYIIYIYIIYIYNLYIYNLYIYNLYRYNLYIIYIYIIYIYNLYIYNLYNLYNYIYIYSLVFSFSPLNLNMSQYFTVFTSKWLENSWSLCPAGRSSWSSPPRKNGPFVSHLAWHPSDLSTCFLGGDMVGLKQ